MLDCYERRLKAKLTIRLNDWNQMMKEKEILNFMMLIKLFIDTNLFLMKFLSILLNETAINMTHNKS